MPEVKVNFLYVLLQILNLITKTTQAGNLTCQAARFATQQVEPSRMEKSM
jgi:hypothetical protein